MPIADREKIIYSLKSHYVPIILLQGMRTYDYILAMREANRFSALDPLNDSDFSSDDCSEPSSPVKPTVLSQIMCKGQRKNLVKHLQFFCIKAFTAYL